MSHTKTKQWEHQRKGNEWAFEHIQKYGFAFLTMDMGTGKTKTSIDTIVQLATARQEIKRVLVVCPKAVVPVWPMEFETHCAAPYRMLALSGKDSVTCKTEKAHAFLKYNTNKLSVIAINYESAWRAPFGEWLLRYYQPQIIVADESHKLKSPFSKQSKFFSQLSSKHHVRAKIATTGTPMASPLDLFAQYRFMNPIILGGSFVAFKHQYATLGGPDKKFIVGFKNLDQLQAIYEKHSFSVRADEVLDLPAYKDEILFAEMNPTSKRMYKEIDDDLISSLPDDLGNVEVANAMTKILHLQQVTSGFAKSDGKEVEIDDGKLKALEEWLDGVPQDEPIVVFTRFILDATRVHALLKSLGRNPGYQTGAGSDWQEFQRGGIDSIVVNVASGGAGIALTRARYAVYYSVGYNVLDYSQSRRRLVRPGQLRPVTFYHICIPKTVDQHIYTLYRNRMSAVSQVAEELMSDAELARNVLSMMKTQKEEVKRERRERTLIGHHGPEVVDA